MSADTIKTKIERETGKFIKLQTSKFKDDGKWLFTGYATVGDVEGKKIGSFKDHPTGNAEEFMSCYHVTAEYARLGVLTQVELRHGLIKLV
jgi:hypothetical protein